MDDVRLREGLGIRRREEGEGVGRGGEGTMDDEGGVSERDDGMNEAMDSVIVSESDEGTPVPARVPGAFVVDLLEETGRMDRGEAEVLLSILEWVEVEARGFPDLLEGLCRLRGAVMKAAAAGRVV